MQGLPFNPDAQRSVLRFALTLLLLRCSVVAAQLPDVSYEAHYPGGPAIAYTFANGVLEYRLLGPGIKNTGLQYQSRTLGDQQYLVSWNDETNKFFMTLVIDFANRKEYFSSILSYGSEEPETNFLEAEISAVRFLQNEE